MDVEVDTSKRKVAFTAETKSDPHACVTVDTSEIFSIFSKVCPGIYDEEEGICCLAKMYDFVEGAFRLNDMVEIVGIYTADPILYAVEERERERDVGPNSALADLLDPFGGFEDEDDSLSLPPPRYSL